MSTKKLTALVVLSLALTYLTVLLGSPVVRLIRITIGSLKFWMLGLGILISLLLVRSLELMLFTSLWSSIWVTIGFYTEAEQRGFGWKKAILASTSLGAIWMSGVAFISTKLVGVRVDELLKKTIETFLKGIQDATAVKIPTEDVLLQIPSAIIIILLLSLGVSLIYEKRVFTWSQIYRDKVSTHLKLLEIRLPDIIIWISIFAFLASFVDVGNKAVNVIGTNVLNIMLVLFFFQGLAVVETLLILIRAGTFVRIAVYILLIGQLFLLSSAIGFFDYWLDFRRRLKTLRSVDTKQ